MLLRVSVCPVISHSLSSCAKWLLPTPGDIVGKVYLSSKKRPFLLNFTQISSAFFLVLLSSPFPYAQTPFLKPLELSPNNMSGCLHTWSVHFDRPNRSPAEVEQGSMVYVQKYLCLALCRISSFRPLSCRSSISKASAYSEERSRYNPRAVNIHLLVLSTVRMIGQTEIGLYNHSQALACSRTSAIFGIWSQGAAVEVLCNYPLIL